MLTIAPASILYTVFLYLSVLLFLGVTYLAVLQAREERGEVLPEVRAA